MESCLNSRGCDSIVGSTVDRNNSHCKMKRTLQMRLRLCRIRSILNFARNLSARSYLRIFIYFLRHTLLRQHIYRQALEVGTFLVTSL